MAIKEQSESGTRERIIDAAEPLFAESGFDLVSLRDITNRAGANVASVNYHFGSKDNLMAAVVERHALPINQARIAMLDAAEARHGEAAVPVDEILRAFLRPFLDHLAENEFNEALFCKFMGRMSGEQSWMPPSVLPLFQEMAGRYARAIRKAVPKLTEQEALWRIHFSFGVVAHALMHGDTLGQISGGRCGQPGVEVLLNRIVEFCAAGLNAPPGART